MIERTANGGKIGPNEEEREAMEEGEKVKITKGRRTYEFEKNE